MGFVVGVTHRSEDALGMDEAAALVNLAPPFVTTVLVTHLLDAGEVLALASGTGVGAIQLPGVETPAGDKDPERVAAFVAAASGALRRPAAPSSAGPWWSARPR